VKPDKVREMSDDELRTRERELQEQLFRLRFQKSLGQLDNASKIRDTRRDIARVKTVLRQNKQQAQAPATPEGISLASSSSRSLSSREAGVSSGIGISRRGRPGHPGSARTWTRRAV
jgi:large subunit ribosomal protein L29